MIMCSDQAVPAAEALLPPRRCGLAPPMRFPPPVVKADLSTQPLRMPRRPRESARVQAHPSGRVPCGCDPGVPSTTLRLPATARGPKQLVSN